MKKTRYIAGAVIILALVCVLGGCNMNSDSVSVEERVKMFISDANAKSYSSLKAHTHPDAAQYNQANSSFWETRLETALNLSYGSRSGDTVLVNGNSTSFTFYLKEDDPDVYKIYKIVQSGNATPIFQ
ncbi:hypothetical protein K7I13_03085 [Brucepastera parasyntrophica]|uniref:hypothetical protein n=1 Tax=Brucepastera parasyntrophica TaxID=2880008 RepID=UPI00210C1B81|nr:hypothetical protein [Brucepastera parasyntrophica]ULQ60308.1 hypothetical protein K7I13_03085 [Brucepastera parasyntrophica]